MKNSRDLGYFVRMPALRTPAAPRPEVASLALVRGSGPRMNRIAAVLMALAGVFGGLLIFVLLSVLSAFTFSSGNALSFSAGIGSVVAALGLGAGILVFRAWSVRPAILVSLETAVLRYPGFRKPFVFDRSLVRVVTIDDRQTKLFTNNKRFPVAGRLAPDVFADALDQFPRPPWEPRDGTPSGPTGPTVPSDRRPQSTEPDPGGEEGFLWGDGGSALHLIRVNAEDVPNIAVLFHEPVLTPAAPLGYLLSPHCGFFPGRKRIRGFMARVENPEHAGQAFEAWGVVRQVTAADVLEEGLRLPKPLRGWRIPAYAAAFGISLVLKILLRHRA